MAQAYFLLGSPGHWKNKVHQNQVQKIKFDTVFMDQSISSDYGAIPIDYDNIKKKGLSNLMMYLHFRLCCFRHLSHKYSNHTSSSGLAKGFSSSMFKGLKSGVTCNNNRFITPNRNFYLEKKYLWLHETTNKNNHITSSTICLERNKEQKQQWLDTGNECCLTWKQTR